MFLEYVTEKKNLVIICILMNECLKRTYNLLTALFLGGTGKMKILIHRKSSCLTFYGGRADGEFCGTMKLLHFPTCHRERGFTAVLLISVTLLLLHPGV
mmetsp:Transcript_2850/g.4051  ORF Transcript_2850/g.4051 Transcript_2850/m.4051 type:complete len:99 (+) Transcript_2850:188-484(+)